jgi:hypothetical protein
MLPSMLGERKSRSRMRLSEVMTIVISFHGSGYKTFKEFYNLTIIPFWRKAFPHLVKLYKICGVEALDIDVALLFLTYTQGEVTRISFIDSTPIDVCVTCRAHAHKVFKGMVNWGKNSVGWHFGFKLDLIVNDKGELLAFKLTPANVDDREPVPDMAQDLFGKLFGDRGYISQKLFEQLYQQGLQLITKRKKKMKNCLVKLIDKILLRKRAIIEAVNDQLKNISQIEHSRHCSIFNFLVFGWFGCLFLSRD